MTKIHHETPKKNLPKFIFFSIIGFFLFLVPVPYKSSFTIPVGILIDWIKAFIHNHTMIPLIILVSLNAIGTIITKVFKPNFIMSRKWFRDTFDTPMLYVISRIVGMIIVFMHFFHTGPQAIISDATGGVMIDLMRTLISVLIVISFTMPLLTEFGIMEFVGVLISKYVRPLFLVPGRAAIDLITSWLGASNAAVLLTKQQYDKGFYTGKEAGIIMTNFSFVSVPFAYIIATILKVEQHFTQFYIICTVTGFSIALIMCRIFPLKQLPSTYSEKVGKQVDEEVPLGLSRFQFAVQSAAERAAKTTAQDVLHQGMDMFSSVIFGLAPIIIAWGTISLILVEFTPVFKYISYPMALLLQLLGIPEAMSAAPSTLVGFADMFIPPLLLAPMAPLKTRFIVGAATLLQLIYLTEVGAIIIQSDVPLDFKKLLIIFLERTVLALVFVTILSKFIMGF